LSQKQTLLKHRADLKVTKKSIADKQAEMQKISRPDTFVDPNVGEVVGNC
jgi:hypothetical protein